MEEKREKFKRLAESRTNKVIDMLGLIGNLSNQSNYEYTARDVNKIFSSIEKALDVQRERFNSNLSKRRRFKL
ncbi:MAG: hypothetical protein E6759_06780 [Veillonella sp.]|jgi:hypothetical protein|uniref:hypothetical protein n=1 Tax=Veillonella TaxID=29465 RepID=UPI0012BAF9AE|nr:MULTISPECIES: hypothetical protein [Veillonella]MDU6763766.1 hypothetical protein [Staphylococcus sp.]MBS6382364.1 hypothetical protein [Veillonella dispar]MBS6483443.1 hypothetical protein [Veillonella sp.]MDU1409899.1 hypothetical protein [Veillonella sp.]MDU1939322.1 hypothetical protein [Veillonella sp.]